MYIKDDKGNLCEIKEYSADSITISIYYEDDRNSVSEIYDRGELLEILACLVKKGSKMQMAECKDGEVFVD